jgi:prepilin-type N-terminal cleavage/methylation domain-containing protein
MLMLKDLNKKRSSGFTLVEIIVVIVIIGILVVLSLFAYRGYRERAVASQGQHAIRELVDAIKLARLNNRNTILSNITGSTWTSRHCYDSSDGGNNTTHNEPATLPKTNQCWVDYYAQIDKIAAASGVNLDAVKKGDARGNPYYIDENEQEYVASGYLCVRDVVTMFRPNTALIYERYPEDGTIRSGGAKSNTLSWYPANYTIPSGIDPFKVEVYVPLAQPPSQC